MMFSQLKLNLAKQLKQQGIIDSIPEIQNFKQLRLTDLGLEKGKAHGICEAPHVPGKAMDIPVHGGTQEDLCTIPHEGLHACLWDLDEEAVHETSCALARLLWRLGWRKQLENRA